MKVFLGIGNSLRQDDGFGVHVLKDLDNEIGGRSDCLFFECGVAPVSILGKVPDKPEELFLLDALKKDDLDQGESILVEVEEFSGKKPISTHRLPFKVIQDSLKPEETYLAGAKPVKMGFGKELSSECEEAKEELVEKILNFIN